MDKRKEANLLVKQRITGTLFSLMEQKSLAEITVTELVEQAGVARASFYRNYASKEDVLIKLVQGILDEFGRESRLDSGGVYSYENILLSFQYCSRYRRYILDLCRSGFMSVLLEELNHFHESVEGSMPSSSIEKYRLYMYTGALLNTALVWLAGDSRTSPEEIARFFYSSFAKAARLCEKYPDLAE